MPIKPEHRARYPANWGEIRASILERAQGSCEWCGVPNSVWRNRGTGAWTRNPEQVDAWAIDGDRVTKIVLTIAHLDHQPENNEPANLRALCQRCHLDWDRDHHAESAARTRCQRRERAGQIGLVLS